MYLKEVTRIPIYLLVFLCLLLTESVAAAKQTSLFQQELQQTNLILEKMYLSEETSIPKSVRMQLLELSNWDDVAFQIFELNKNNKDALLILAAARYDNQELLKEMLDKYPESTMIKENFLFVEPTELAVQEGNTQIIKLFAAAWGKEYLLSRDRDLVIMATSLGHTDQANYLLSLEGGTKLTDQQAEAIQQQFQEREKQQQGESIKRQALILEIEKNLPHYQVDIPTEKRSGYLSPEERKEVFQLLGDIYTSPVSSIEPFVERFTAITKAYIITGGKNLFLLNKDAALLLYTAKFNHIALFEKLLLQHLDYSPLSKTFDGDSPMGYAISSGNLEIATLITKTWGTEQISTGSFFKTPLVIAVRNNQLEAVKYLLDAGAAWSDSFKDPVVIAMVNGNRDMAKILMLHQDVTQLTDDQYNKIFQKAIDDFKMDLADTIVDFITDADQKSLYYAAAIGNEKIADKLISLPSIDLTTPAQTNFFNRVETQGKTADEIALAFGHPELAERLRIEKQRQVAHKQHLEAERLAQENKSKLFLTGPSGLTVREIADRIAQGTKEDELINLIHENEDEYLDFFTGEQKQYMLDAGLSTRLIGILEEHTRQVKSIKEERAMLAMLQQEDERRAAEAAAIAEAQRQEQIDARRRAESEEKKQNRELFGKILAIGAGAVIANSAPLDSAAKTNFLTNYSTDVLTNNKSMSNTQQWANAAGQQSTQTASAQTASGGGSNEVARNKQISSSCKQHSKSYNDGDGQTTSHCQHAIYNKCVADEMCTLYPNKCSALRARVTTNCEILSKMGFNGCPACN